MLWFFIHNGKLYKNFLGLFAIFELRHLNINISLKFLVWLRNGKAEIFFRRHLKLFKETKETFYRKKLSFIVLFIFATLSIKFVYQIEKPHLQD